MRRNRIIATVAAGLGVISLIPVATALGDDSSEPQGRSIEAVTALGSSFTYQGRLTDAGSPANGTYDLRFILYDADTAGASVGTTQTKDDVTVTNGLFGVELDFGAGAWNGDARWVEIAVRPGASAGTYTVLSPRQPISPTPYALFAKAAAGIAVPFAASGSLAGAPASTTGLFTVTQTGTGIAIAGNRTSTDVSEYPGVLGTNNGGGAGVQGESTAADGVGVRGYAIGAGGTGGYFYGETGIEIDGAIKVSGANPAAFVHTATVANTNVGGCGGALSHCTSIDNALINGDPTAILIITHRWNEGESILGLFDNREVGVWYEPTSDKWVIYHEDNSTPMPPNAKFNVLVISK
ncbi:MAG: hypothetical protein IT300_16000 [Dehalococcoidia bacterium]|nr:hypothetical protein [Dehalococcoidia bacterium]